MNEQNNHAPSQYPATFDPKLVSRNALTVVEQLQSAGYEAYIVGGSVRDLLLGLKPKDFDVATSATPEEVKAEFNNARAIGRRFKLVHVRLSREIIEVATFRAHYNNPNSVNNQGNQPSLTNGTDTDHGAQLTGNHSTDSNHHNSTRFKTNAHGMVLHDNVYGNIEEDALRRDFTINALYYDPFKGVIIDHTRQGIADINNRTLCLIGDPSTRYREDPVRMLRVARFKTKLGFQIAPATLEPIIPLSSLLNNIPAARLFDEAIKLLHNGHALSNYLFLQELQLFKCLFPQTVKAADGNEQFEKMIQQALSNTDKRVPLGKPVTPAFLYAVMLWAPFCHQYQQQMCKKKPLFTVLQKAGQDVLSEQARYTSIPRRFVTSIKEIWELQFRLDKRHGYRADRLMEHPRFRAAYDFLLLRESSGEIAPGLGEWWTNYQEANQDQRQDMLAELPDRKRRPRKNRSTGSKNVST